MRESISEYSEFALPTDANTLGNVLGGKVMHLVDLAAALAAVRHARCAVVTASVDQMSFPASGAYRPTDHAAIERQSRVSNFHGSGRARGSGEPAHRPQEAHFVRVLDVRRGGRKAEGAFRSRR